MIFRFVEPGNVPRIVPLDLQVEFSRETLRSVRRRAHQLARSAYENLCAELMGAVAAGSVDPDDVWRWRPDSSNHICVVAPSGGTTRG